MDIQFIFIDDSFNEDTKYSSLTCILIPLDKFEKIRDDFYDRILNQFIILGDSSFNLSPIILHGKELLKVTAYQDDNEKKIKIFQNVKVTLRANAYCRGIEGPLFLLT